MDVQLFILHYSYQPLHVTNLEYVTYLPHQQMKNMYVYHSTPKLGILIVMAYMDWEIPFSYIATMVYNCDL